MLLRGKFLFILSRPVKTHGKNIFIIGKFNLSPFPCVIQYYINIPNTNHGKKPGIRTRNRENFGRLQLRARGRIPAPPAPGQSVQASLAPILGKYIASGGSGSRRTSSDEHSKHKAPMRICRSFQKFKLTKYTTS